MMFLLLANLCAQTEKVASLKVKAKYIFMADYESQDIILEYNADELMCPSSMTKIMTALVAFQALRDKKVQPDTMVTVEKEAFRTEGTTMFLNLNQVVSVMDLVRGVICVSGNDASKTLAVAICGSEEAFAQKMTEMAKKIGTQKTYFTNASGLPDEDHQTTPRDLFKITHYLIKYFPKEYALFKEKSFCFNAITQPNKNILLKKEYFDGVKTGFTDKGKYGMVASMVDPLSKRRIILVVNGLSSEKERAEEADRLITWGLRQTKNVNLFKEGDVITEVSVRFGDKNKIALVTDMPVCVTLEVEDQIKPTYEIILPTKYIKGPLPKGAIVGQIVVKTSVGNKAYDLKTRDDIGKASWMRKLFDWVRS